MRVLYLTDSYRPARSACANRAVVIVDALRAAGHDVQVLASSDSLLGVSDGYVKPKHVTFFKTYPLVEKKLINRVRNNFCSQHESIKITRSMGDFNVVICTTPPLLLTTSAIKIAKQKHAKLVLDVRDIWPDVAYEMGSFAPGSVYGRFFNHIAHKAYAQADLVVSVSPGKVAKLKNRVPNGRVELIPNGIDENFLSNEEDTELVEHLNLDLGPYCAYVGNIGLAQGLGTLLDIAKVRPDVRFLLFGDGADKATLEQRVKSEALRNVEFCGVTNEHGVYTVLRHAAVAYVPLVSSRLRDSIPTKMYEALACGCPVLLAAEGDAADLLDKSGLGLHAKPEDPSAILRAFDEIMTVNYLEPDRMAAMRYVVANHSRQRFAKLCAEKLVSYFGEQSQ